jgi:hypothetical protein
LIYLNKYKKKYKELFERINFRKKLLFNLDKSTEWYEQNKRKIEFLFEYDELRNYIFDKFSVLWEKGNISKDKEIFAIITQVSVANAILAGIPGKLGIGVYICIALEFYLALAIARRVGFNIPDDDQNETELKKWIWVNFKSLAPYGLYFSFAGFIAIYAFKHMFSFVFSIMSGPVPFVVVFTEYVLTTFVGILFWTAFEQINDPKNPKILYSSFAKTKDLLSHQKDSIRHTFTTKNVQNTFDKLKDWFTGNIFKDLPNIRGDVFVSASIGFLLAGKHEAFDGPIGKIFIKSIKDRWSELEDASIGKISEFMKEKYSDDQIPGVINTIKGKLFENLSVAHENQDGDEWTAYLHENQSYPGSDMIMTNYKTGEILELSLKATDNLHYIESSLLKYPEFPILTTFSEIPDEYPYLEMLIASEFSNREIQEITESNFEELVDNLTPITRLSGVAAVSTGVAGVAFFSLWPFVVAYKRKIISKERLIDAFKKVFPKAGEELVYRILLMVICGPIYGWYVLAKTAIKFTPKPEDTIYLSYAEKGNNKNEIYNIPDELSESKGWITRLVSKFKSKG